MRRVLPPRPIRSLPDHRRAGGGAGLDAARELGPDGVVEHLAAAGLRGRGGAGFPTGTKWETVRGHASAAIPATVVVNAAEGEPGSFKDRILLRWNPYAVVEGALVAAGAVGADRVIVAVKASFTEEAGIVRRVFDECSRAGWADGVELLLVEGPSEYLFGEETGLLEVIDGRPPFPRVAPPFRHGVEEVSDDDGVDPAQVVAAASGGTDAPPTLVNNVETLANVPGILARGPAWFRSAGTDESPGTIVCTITGCTVRHGVGEVVMGTPLRQVLDAIGGGARPGQRIVGVMSGVAHPILTEDQLDTPVSYEAMEAIGSGLGAAGFVVFDDTTDFAAVAHGVARFLAVESCGQCTPCKQDGLALTDLFDRIRRSDAHDLDLLAVEDHLRTVTDGARCFLAHQQQRVLGSIVERFGDVLRAHAEGKVEAAAPELTVPIRDLGHGTVVFDEHQAAKQPDWTFDAVDSGKSPVERWEHEWDRDDVPVPPVRTTAPAPTPSTATRPEAEVIRTARPVHGIPPDEVDPDDPEARLYTSAPVETDEGTVVIQQQTVGKDNEQGGGEWPDPDTPPQRPAPGAS
jgi:NADH:ubiquinone oxidoreductase subunit F (NADH-binding)